jgi:DNA-binding transcriptional LysR family regulator
MAGLDGMDLNLLIALGALLEERNLTHAGAKISMSQPAMSGARGRLRKHFDDELLVRVGRDYELTPLAVRMLPLVQEALRQVERTLEASPHFDAETSRRRFSVSMSDYAITVLVDPLLARVAEIAPGVTIDLSPIPGDMDESDRGLLMHDLLIAPRGYGFPGRSEVLFRDRFVCLVDPRNPRLRDGALTLDDLAALPHAKPEFGGGHTTPAERLLDELGVEREVRITAAGWLTLPFLVAGTDLVAIVPERLARRVAETAHALVVEPPFDRVDLVEAAWWHPSRSADPSLRWLRAVLRAVAEAMAA